MTFVIPPWCPDLQPGVYAQGDESDSYVMHYSQEQTRAILPNALKANIIMTANMREWRHVFRLRALGLTGRPHPQMVQVIVPLLEAFKKEYSRNPPRSAIRLVSCRAPCRIVFFAYYLASLLLYTPE